jgi:hypothetical protein
MTGMKEGAGENPFADDDDTTAEAGADESNPDAADSDPNSPDSDPDHQGADRSIQIPYKFRRDGVQDGRDRVPLFLKADTKRSEREAVRELEDRFDDDISLTDLREALVKAGLQNLDQVQAHLEEWGYGVTFDE